MRAIASWRRLSLKSRQVDQVPSRPAVSRTFSPSFRFVSLPLVGLLRMSFYFIIIILPSSCSLFVSTFVMYPSAPALFQLLSCITTSCSTTYSHPTIPASAINTRIIIATIALSSQPPPCLLYHYPHPCLYRLLSVPSVVLVPLIKNSGSSLHFILRCLDFVLWWSLWTTKNTHCFPLIVCSSERSSQFKGSEYW